MADQLRFDDRVVLITGAGNGLGRSHALLFAGRGAKVVVNDLGGSGRGEGESQSAADRVVEEIRAAGGTAVANYDSVENGAAIVKTAIDAFGRIDVVVNNAGILRDQSFQKMVDADWDLIFRVHVAGAARVTHAAWAHMREQGYGRVIMTSSAAGLYGNFGQTNYGAAKMALVGFMNTLAVEGRKANILVNSIAPIAASRLTEGLLPPDMLEVLKPEYVSPLVAFLCHESCKDTGAIFEVGGGLVSRVRWERSKGWGFATKNGLTPEAIAAKWSAINDFAGADHPASIADSMAALAEHIAHPKRGGNKFIDLDVALAAPPVVLESAYEEKDVSLYALGVGAGANPLDASELALVHERGRDFRVLPTFGVMPAINAFLQALVAGQQPPGMNVTFDRVLHGEQYTEVKRPLPPKAKLTHKASLRDAYDKGEHAVGIIDVRSCDEDGEEIVRNEITFFLRGAGGWGGERGPSGEANVPPAREPDAVIEEKTSPSQALLYRLLGDWNPLHVDPAFARAFGFDRPILHGLCTYGYAGRHVVKAFLGNDPRRMKSIKVRFSKNVFPGETLVTRMWKESDTRIVFETSVKERGEVVIKNAAVELFGEIPAPKAKKAPAAKAAATTGAAAPSPDKAAAGATASLTPAVAFGAIDKYIAANPSVVEKGQAVVQIKLTEPDGDWVLDLKHGAGGARSGQVDKADVTMTVTTADFMDVCLGKADAQKLFFAGKMKLAGNMMVAQKLDFLRKLDRKLFDDELARQGGASAPAPAPASAPASAPAPTSTVDVAGLFAKLAERLAESPNLGLELPGSYQFVVDAHAFVVDARGVRAGKEAGAAVTLTLGGEELALLSKGETSAERLFQSGKLRVDGDVRLAHHLGFMQRLV